jgi:hypothetical protein
MLDQESEILIRVRNIEELLQLLIKAFYRNAMGHARSAGLSDEENATLDEFMKKDLE